jgi:hypothetical protein
MNYSVSEVHAYIIYRQDSIVLIRLVDRLDLKEDLKMCLGLGDVLPEDLKGADRRTVGHTIQNVTEYPYLVEFLMWG